MKLSSIKIAASADWHLSRFKLQPEVLENLSADPEIAALLIAGDMTDNGKAEEIAALADLLAACSLPTFAVLGNHDCAFSSLEEFRQGLSGRQNVRVLNGEAVVLEKNGLRVGLAATKGYVGGFAPYRMSGHGEPAMERVMEEEESERRKLSSALDQLRVAEVDITLAMLHYAPFAENLGTEPRELYPVLGSSRLGEVLLEKGADLVVHGHAHAGAAGLFSISRRCHFSNVGLRVNGGNICIFECALEEGAVSVKSVALNFVPGGQ